jgi:hypothetical protein
MSNSNHGTVHSPLSASPLLARALRRAGHLAREQAERAGGSSHTPVSEMHVRAHDTQLRSFCMPPCLPLPLDHAQPCLPCALI